MNLHEGSSHLTTLMAIPPRELSLLQFEERDYPGGLGLVLIETWCQLDDLGEQRIALVNATPFGLGGSVFTADIERGHSVARRIESGMEFVNHSTFTAPELPFGGIKNSGYGRELSELGFGEFVNRKLIDVSPAGSPPPIG